jgi:hypothetical protein
MGTGSVLIHVGVLGFTMILSPVCDVLMNGIGIGMAALLILWQGMSADKADKLVPARSCTYVN